MALPSFMQGGTTAASTAPLAKGQVGDLEDASGARLFKKKKRKAVLPPGNMGDADKLNPKASRLFGGKRGV